MVISFFSRSLSCSGSCSCMRIFSTRCRFPTANFFLIYSFFLLFLAPFRFFLSFSFTRSLFGDQARIHMRFSIFLYFSIASLLMFVHRFFSCILFCSFFLFVCCVVVDAAVLFLGYKIFGCIHPIHMESSHSKCIESIVCLVRMVLLPPTQQTVALARKRRQPRRQQIKVLTVILLAIHHAN